MEQHIRYCKTPDGVRIAYASVGEGPPIVRALGWFTHLEYEWENPLLRSGTAIYGIEVWAANHQYVRYDGRCMGLSDRGVRKLGLEESVMDLETVIDAAGLDKFILLGVSAGGPAAITYAMRHPERVTHLVLYGTFVRPPGTLEERRMMVEMVRHGWDSDVPAHRLFFTGLFVPDGADAEAIRTFNEIQRLSANAEDVVAWLSSIPEGLDLTDVLPEVQAPTLIIHRRGDAIVPFELGREIAAGIPGARFLPVDGRNHWPQPNEAAVEVMRKAIEEFLGTAGEHEQRSGSTLGGLVTILFTDIEGSTDLTRRLGDAAAQDLLRHHNVVVRDALKAHGGSEIKHTGDGIMASFASARGALDCAIAIQKAFGEQQSDVGAQQPREKAGSRGPSSVAAPQRPAVESRSDSAEPIRVRIGLNAGEPVAEDRDLFGAAVQLAARVCARAEGGQVLVSNVVRELTMGKGFLFSDLGDFIPKGFEDPVRLYEVRWRE